MTVEGLTPCTEYTFSVAGMSGDRTGQFSDGMSQMADGESKHFNRVVQIHQEQKQKHCSKLVSIVVKMKVHF